MPSKRWHNKYSQCERYYYIKHKISFDFMLLSFLTLDTSLCNVAS